MPPTVKDSGRTVSVPFVDLGAAAKPFRARILEDLAELANASMFVNGPYVEAFEGEFALATGRQSCVGVSSGLDALRLALIASGLEAGDEVVVPAMTFIATFEAVVQAGGRPVVADIRADDACIDVEAVAAAVGPRTRFVMPVHLYGQMADGRALVEIAERHGVSVIEDAAQAHGAERDGIRAGSIGVAAAFSFYPSKNLGAWGDAGAVVLDDEPMTATLRALREHGQTRRYHSELAGYTARLDAVQALVLSRKLPLLDGWNAERRRAAAVYDECLTGVGDLRLPAAVAGSTHVWHLYTVRTADPTALGEFLSTRAIATGRHYPEPPHLSPAFADLGLAAGSFPVAEAVARETLSLPIYPGIADEQLEAVVAAVSDFFRRA